MADAFHAIWGLWWYNFVKIEIQILDVSIFWYTNIACYRSHLFHHHVALQKEGQRHLIKHWKMGPWVTFRISFCIGFHCFFCFCHRSKKNPKPTGTHFWYGDRHRVTWCAVFFLQRQICGRQSWAVVWKAKKSHLFFFFVFFFFFTPPPPPLFLPWIIKRKLGYFDFEQRIWTIEHFEIKLGLKQAGTANCWKPQSWFPWFQEGERKTWLKVTDPATWRILREWLMCHVFWTGTFGSAISSDSCLGCTVILRERSLRLLLS